MWNNQTSSADVQRAYLLGEYVYVSGIYLP